MLCGVCWTAATRAVFPCWRLGLAGVGATSASEASSSSVSSLSSSYALSAPFSFITRPSISNSSLTCFCLLFNALRNFSFFCCSITCSRYRRWSSLSRDVDSVLLQRSARLDLACASRRSLAMVASLRCTTSIKVAFSCFNLAIISSCFLTNARSDWSCTALRAASLSEIDLCTSCSAADLVAATARNLRPSRHTSKSSTEAHISSMDRFPCVPSRLTMRA
mmetsp:Transcript_32086/g.73327  ORF Transcript_32086/g.73327 Transcript_32086/m.73327 type:complete len:221 (-) Transcript_32086:326-988(-)